MNPSTKQHQTTSDSKQAIQQDAKGLFQNLKIFLVELFDFREDTDQEATIEAIKADIPFKGATAWILIFAVFVASIGLNADSTAVVIGAMLISPLMGPILGIGMSFALNDFLTFKKSLMHLGTMIVLSLFASFLFFYIFPLSEDTSELLGRVRPDIRDVLIAFFGGLALMVAKTKKGTVASVIFGVAIATALMPPLCTAGYGLAKGNFTYFFGAMYLFTINTIFIALATFLVLKLLRFPMHKYANAARRKRYSTIATVVGISVMIPAIFTFISVFKENQIENQVSTFIKNEVKLIPNFQLIDESFLPKTKEIYLNFFNEVSDGEKNILTNQLRNNPRYDKIKDFDLKIKGIANFLGILKVDNLVAQIPSGANVNIDLSETRLVGITYMDYLVEFLKSQRDSGGRVFITGLDSHVSSTTYNRALKISLNNSSKKLSQRQKRLRNLATEKDYQYTSQVDWNTIYLKKFHFFEIRPIESKYNCLKGTYEV